MSETHQGTQWRLMTSTWINVSRGAQHYYAELDGGRGSCVWRICRAMRRADIVKLNKARREMGLRLTSLEPGQRCEGFDTLDDAVAAGTVVFMKLCGAGDSLVHYTSETAWCVGDGHLLYGPDGNKYVYGDRARRDAIVKRTAAGWELMELDDA